MQLLGPVRMPQFTQGFGLNLTDTFTGHVKLFADFFQGMIGVHFNTKTHPQYFGFAWGQTGQNFLDSFTKPEEVAKSTGDSIVVSSIKSPRFESSSSPMGVSIEIGSLAIFKTLRILSSVMSIFLASSSGVGSRPVSCNNLTANTVQFINGFNHVHGYANGARLISNGSRDRLTNPPGGVG